MPSSLTFCFHAGYSEYTSYALPSSMRRSDRAESARVEIVGPAAPTYDQAQRCRESLRPLMLKDIGDFCRLANNGECSIGGAYQPPIPSAVDPRGKFVGVSSYRYAWEFLQLPRSATLKQFKLRSEHICSLSFGDLLLYFSSNGFNMIRSNDIHEFLPYFCFLSSYVIVLVEGGHTLSFYGFLLYLCRWLWLHRRTRANGRGSSEWE